MKPIRHVMVHLDGTPRSMARLRLAHALAVRHEAQLTGLFATMSPIPLPYEYAVSDAAVQAFREVHHEWRAAARSMFEQVTDSRREHSQWLESDDEFVAAGVARRALLADLLVLGQEERDDLHAARLPSGFIPSVLTASGCPALVVPYTGEFADVGEKALVAWKATPESARALKAALPLLQSASQVRVGIWGEDSPAEGISVTDYLELHDIPATVNHEGDETRELGELLLSRAADFSADLLVMGCYGHSRAREFVLGGVSRTVLRSMTMPVLMAH